MHRGTGKGRSAVITIGTVDAYLYLLAAFLILVIVLGIGILLGYFLRGSADQHHPVPPTPRARRSSTSEDRARHTRSTTTRGRDRRARDR